MSIFCEHSSWWKHGFLPEISVFLCSKRRGTTFLFLAVHSLSSTCSGVFDPATDEAVLRSRATSEVRGAIFNFRDLRYQQYKEQPIETYDFHLHGRLILFLISGAVRCSSFL